MMPALAVRLIPSRKVEFTSFKSLNVASPAGRLKEFEINCANSALVTDLLGAKCRFFSYHNTSSVQITNS